jgi:hypothetical protein
MEQLGEITAELRKNEVDGSYIGYMSGLDAPTLYTSLLLRNIHGSEGELLHVTSMDIELSLRNGLGDVMLSQKFEIVPYRTTSASAQVAYQQDGYACLLLRGQVSTVSYDKYCNEEASVMIDQKAYNYIHTRFGSSDTPFAANISINKVWFSDGSSFGRRRGYERPPRFVAQTMLSGEPSVNDTVRDAKDIKRMTDAVSPLRGDVDFTQTEGFYTGVLALTTSFHNHTGKVITGAESKLTVYGPRGDIIVTRTLKHEISEAYQAEPRFALVEMYVPHTVITMNAYANRLNLVREMPNTEYYRLARLASRKCARVKVEILGLVFADGTKMGTLKR